MRRRNPETRLAGKFVVRDKLGGPLPLVDRGGQSLIVVQQKGAICSVLSFSGVLVESTKRLSWS